MARDSCLAQAPSSHCGELVVRFDHILHTTSMSESCTYKGSMFQQMVNTRHLLLHGTISCKYPERLPAAQEDKLGHFQLQARCKSLEHDLLSLTNNQYPDPQTSTNLLVPALTTVLPLLTTQPVGAFPEPSQDTHWELSYGPVRACYTGELTALVELCDSLLYRANLPSFRYNNLH